MVERTIRRHNTRGTRRVQVPAVADRDSARRPGQFSLARAMPLSRRSCLQLLLGAAVPWAARAAENRRSAPSRPAEGADATAYKGAIVLDAGSGRILLADRADYRGPPASVAKLMTFLIVHDRLRRRDLTLETLVPTTAEAARTGGSQVYLAEKEIFPVEDLLHALMIGSANDTAVALAVHLAGSREAFVGLMNTRARELGMTQTLFRSPHGLPPSSRKIEDGDLTSPRDLANLSLQLIRQTNVLAYTSVKQRTFRPGPRRIEMVNHNHLLGKVAGVDGLKTGFTRGAGFCLAATAFRNGRRVIAVTMGSPDSKTRDIKIAELLEKGFLTLPPPSPEDAPVQPAPKPPAPPAAPADGETTVRFKLPGR